MSVNVSFVSAGPGDPELLTLKGAARIKSAEVILYDDLASSDLLKLARKDTNLVSAGKRAGHPSAKQDHVSRLLVDYAKAGAKVVRLKSGDAGIFGRLEEETRPLRAAGLSFEIIPGVSSASAAAAAAGISLTRRVMARRVQFITGADISGGLPRDLNWPALVDTSAVTAVYMGKRTFPELARQLCERGLAASTPAILAESIGHPSQRIVRTTISDLAEQLANETISSPATILYGPLADD